MTSDEHWFQEPPQAGHKPLYEVRAHLHRRRSPFQTVEIIDTVLFGRALVLDEIVQTTERDEFFYHEMLVHPALLAHPRPRRVLIVGGGDGGSLRRVLEHGVEHVTMVEIDREVVEVCQEYLPSVSAGAFDDPRAELRFEDGYAFVEARSGKYDVAIVDGPDPIGVGKVLFSEPFYRALADVLEDDGIACVQSESPLMMATQTARTHLALRASFPAVRTYLATVPAYPLAVWSFTIAAKSGDVLPPRAVVEERVRARRLRAQYYTPAVHEAAFVLPAYLERFLDDSVRRGVPSDEHPFFPEAQGITVGEPAEA